MFVDVSAMVAILLREPEADMLADRLDRARGPLTSPLAVSEAVLTLCQKRHASIAEAQADVRELLELAHIRVVTITQRDMETALGAFGRYGKGRSHPAQLSLSDCFAYAVVQAYHVPLLFKGAGFAQTDIRPATSVGS